MGDNVMLDHALRIRVTAVFENITKFPIPNKTESPQVFPDIICNIFPYCNAAGIRLECLVAAL
jgi:hypothetical protein